MTEIMSTINQLIDDPTAKLQIPSTTTNFDSSLKGEEFLKQLPAGTWTIKAPYPLWRVTELPKDAIVMNIVEEVPNQRRLKESDPKTYYQALAVSPSQQMIGSFSFSKSKTENEIKTTNLPVEMNHLVEYLKNYDPNALSTVLTMVTGMRRVRPVVWKTPMRRAFGLPVTPASTVRGEVLQLTQKISRLLLQVKKDITLIESLQQQLEGKLQNVNIS